MIQRRTLALTDGSAVSAQAFQLLLDMAAPLAMKAISFLFHSSAHQKPAPRMLPCLSLGEVALATAPCYPFAVGDQHPTCARGVATDIEFGARASARGLTVTGESRSNLDTEEVVRIASRHDFVFDCRNRFSNCRSTNPDPIIRDLLLRGTQPVVLSHPTCPGLSRVVVATRTDGRLDDLLVWGAGWAGCLDVPLAVVSAARTARQLTCQVQVVEAALERLRITARLSGFRCNPAGLTAKLEPSDLLLMGAYGRPWPVELCFGSHTEDLLRSVPCPVGILPSRWVGPGDSSRGDSGLVGDRGIRDNRQSWPPGPFKSLSFRKAFECGKES